LLASVLGCRIHIFAGEGRKSFSAHRVELVFPGYLFGLREEDQTLLQANPDELKFVRLLHGDDQAWDLCDFDSFSPSRHSFSGEAELQKLVW